MIHIEKSETKFKGDALHLSDLTLKRQKPYLSQRLRRHSK